MAKHGIHKAEDLALWIRGAVVDKYHSGNKRVYVVTRGNRQLILTSESVQYQHGLHPHVNMVLIENGKSTLLHQDIIGENYGQITHSTGNMYGDHTPGENIETIWSTLEGVWTKKILT